MYGACRRFPSAPVGVLLLPDASGRVHRQAALEDFERALLHCGEVVEGVPVVCRDS